MSWNAGLRVGLAAIGLASACGGRSPLLASDGGAQEDAALWAGVSDADKPAPAASAFGGSSDGASTGLVQAVDSSPPMLLDSATAVCTQKAGGPAGSQQARNGAFTSCAAAFAATCDGINYQVVCECPRSTCVCFGPTTQVVSYTGCPSCGSGPNPGDPYAGPSTDQVLALCGFPH
jgi:hypothetical protein